MVGAVDSLWLEHRYSILRTLWLEPKQTRDLSVIYQTTKNGVLAVELEVKLSVVHPCYDFAWSVRSARPRTVGKLNVFVPRCSLFGSLPFQIKWINPDPEDDSII